MQGQSKEENAIQHPIDFVVLWVDGDDPAWQKSRQHARQNALLTELCEDKSEEETNGTDENRFRDFGLMRYWFRGIEAFAPWVRYVWFVTNGQKPVWLNLSHPKLRFVTHEAYIPKEYLPTFNSNVIELFLHRLKGLSERFVLFNDDMFLVSETTPGDFFGGKNFLPRESALLDAVTAPNPRDCLAHMLINNTAILNEHFDKRQVLRQNFGKFFTLRYRGELMRNLLLAPFKQFSAFRDPHLPSSYLKSTFETVWNLEGERLLTTGEHKFRSKQDYTHWLMKCWQICAGNTAVRSTAFGRHYELWEDDLSEICRGITQKKYRAVCINDSKTDLDFAHCQAELQKSFAALLPRPSAYEIDEINPA